MNERTRAKIVAGSSDGIVMRVQSDEQIELGDLLVVETPRGYAIMKVYQLAFGSQVPGGIREMLVGMKLEGYGEHLEFLEPELRNYTMAEAVPLLVVSQEGEITKPKSLPKMFSNVRRIEKEDLDFLTEPSDGIYVGRIRSGSKILDLDVFLEGEEVLSHHILIPAITGRGKSNLVKVMLWSIMDKQGFGALVLDPHDEYYGRHRLGLKDHPAAEGNLLYYSTNAPTGASTLTINIRTIHPMDFQGIVQFTQAQNDAIRVYYQRHGKAWIEHIVRGTVVDNVQPVTLSVLQRKMETILGIYADEDNEIVSRNRAFSAISGETTVSSIVDALEEGKKVILDTSIMSDEAELLLGSIIGRAILYRHTSAKARGELDALPVVSVVIEEAPRVLGGEVLHSRGPNIYSRVAREGRKFKMGLVAITQLTSVIPRTILTNMNTKIVLGNEMVTERRAIIDSAAQDLSRDDRLIASLDKGQAIVTSSFTKFAVPIQIPLFEDYAAPSEKSTKEIPFDGVDME